jgi:hypothetical protein
LDASDTGLGIYEGWEGIDSYRLELEKVIDCGDRVMTFYDVLLHPLGQTVR